MKANNYSIHPSVYFIVAALLIAYFFPREGKNRIFFPFPHSEKIEFNREFPSEGKSR